LQHERAARVKRFWRGGGKKWLVEEDGCGKVGYAVAGDEVGGLVAEGRGGAVLGFSCV